MEAKLSAKLQLLKLTKDVAVSDNLEKICRHKEALQTEVAGVEGLKRDIEQEKLEKGEKLKSGERKPKVILTLWTKTSNS